VCVFFSEDRLFYDQRNFISSDCQLQLVCKKLAAETGGSVIISPQEDAAPHDKCRGLTPVLSLNFWSIADLWANIHSCLSDSSLSSRIILSCYISLSGSRGHGQDIWLLIMRQRSGNISRLSLPGRVCQFACGELSWESPKGSPCLWMCKLHLLRTCLVMGSTCTHMLSLKSRQVPTPALQPGHPEASEEINHVRVVALRQKRGAAGMRAHVS